MNALVLSGGGSKGAYIAGVLAAAAADPSWSAGFDFISGTSVGAITAAGLTQFPKSDFPAAAAWVTDLWSNISESNVFTWRFPKYVAGLFRPDLVDTAPLRAFLTAHLDAAKIRTSNVRLRMPAVDVSTSAIREFGSNPAELASTTALVEAVMASAAFPCVFPFVTIDDHLYTDGGLRDITPLGEAIRAGADKILVVLLDDPTNTAEPIPKNVIEMAIRCIDDLCHQILVSDLSAARRANRMPDKRVVDITVVHPSGSLGNSLDFTKSLLLDRMARGKADAQKVFGATPAPV